MQEDNHLCICDPPHAHEYFSWDRILNDVDVSPAHDLKAGIKQYMGSNTGMGGRRTSSDLIGSSLTANTGTGFEKLSGCAYV